MLPVGLRGERSNAFKYTYEYTKSMGHRTLTISDEAYEALAQLKGPRESFTDVVKRIAAGAQKRALTEFAGRIQDEEFEAAAKEIRRTGLQTTPEAIQL